MLGLSASLSAAAASMRSFVKDNLKLYLDFKQTSHNTLKFPCDGSTSFDGTNDYIISGSNSGISGDSARTVSCWVNLTSSSDADPIVCLDENVTDGSGTMFAIVIGVATGGNWAIRVGKSGDDLSSTSSSTSDFDSWVFLTATHDGTTTKLYRNGVEIASGARTLTTTDGSVYIGTDTSRYTNAKVANAGVWSRALSIEEINSVMRKNYSQLKSIEKTSLVSWWALDDTIATAVSSNASTSVEDLHNTETLGTELFSGWTNDGDGGAYNDWDSFSYDASTDTVTASTSSSNDTFRTSFTSEANAVYKISYSLDAITSSVEQRGVSAATNLDSTSLTPSILAYAITHISVGSHTFYAKEGGSGGTRYSGFRAGSGGRSITVSNYSIKKVTNTNIGLTTGSTTTTSVYGGNAPVLPRAVDVAREGEADAIGDGSALFVTGNADYIDTGRSSADLKATGKFSVSCWLKANSYKNWTTPIGDHDDNQQDNGWALFTDDTAGTGRKIGFWVSHYNNRAEAVAGQVGEWYHVAGTYDGTTQRLYINGILSDSADDAWDSATTKTMLIGAGNGSGGIPHTDHAWDGYISQVGLWQGVLTQAQIQAHMESTSYATIPASVKSTLGAELITDGGFDDPSYWNAGGSWSVSGSKATNGASGADIIQPASDDSLVSGRLYKFTATITLVSGSGNFKFYAGDVNTIITATSGTNTYTAYIVSDGATPRIRESSGSLIMEVDNFSVKEVTNDLVGYWGLDESANGATQDSTTGETTRTVVNRDFAGVAHGSDPTALAYIYAYEPPPPTEKVIDNERIKIVDSNNSGVYWKDDGLTSSKLYKITIDATGDVASGGVYSGTISFTLLNGTFTAYKTGITTTGIIYLRANNNNAGTTYYDNLKVEEVTSNTGVLL